MPMEARRGGGGIAPSHPQPGTRMGWLVSTMFPERPGTHCPVRLAGIGAGLDGKEKLTPTGTRYTDRLNRRVAIPTTLSRPPLAALRFPQLISHHLCLWSSIPISCPLIGTSQRTKLSMTLSYVLFNVSVSSSCQVHTAPRAGHTRPLIWKGCVRRRSVSNLRLYHGICLVGRRKAKKMISENSLSEAKNRSQVQWSSLYISNFPSCLAARVGR